MLPRLDGHELFVFRASRLDNVEAVKHLLPREAATQYMKVEPYGLVILILLLATGVLGFLIGPPMDGLRNALFRLLGISL